MYEIPLQHAEEYRNKPIVGAYLRLVRFLAVWASVFLLPRWYLFMTGLLPEPLPFLGKAKLGDIPVFAQLLMIEIGIDMLLADAAEKPAAGHSSPARSRPVTQAF
ncbi:hypothetical protein EP10_001342 [Geobacillus icigianus]|uniref:Uncharacterized protein n=1 Tax=Geobacillus icigianus TaxID=1430331 RepID=A0ABU6BEZ0_9BACL|nr:hypothetical protein B4113_1199 [Geobacillus sp. B4113_201601]MEB3750503.1 hypothetical protein [Geobacillus icigianus]